MNINKPGNINSYYERSAFSVIPLNYNEALKTLVIGSIKGTIYSMTEKEL
jgi:hypothetical protein